MLHPDQFEVSEAWILFRLNHAPIRTEFDGDFNCIALMDAASCFILGSELIPVAAGEPNQSPLRRMFKDAKRHDQHLPTRIFVPSEEVADRVSREATKLGIDIVRLPEKDLFAFIGDAREGFAGQF